MVPLLAQPPIISTRKSSHIVCLTIMGTSDEWFLLNHDLGTPKARGLHSGENTAFTRGITLSELEGNSTGPVIDDRAGGKREGWSVSLLCSRNPRGCTRNHCFSER